MDEITWSLPDGTHGAFIKNGSEPSEDGKLITLSEVKGGDASAEETWGVSTQVHTEQDCSQWLAVQAKADGTAMQQMIASGKTCANARAQKSAAS